MGLFQAFFKHKNFKEMCISSKTNLKKNKQKFTNFLVKKVKPDLIRIWPGQKSSGSYMAKKYRIRPVSDPQHWAIYVHGYGISC
jgi:hypothetical protein